MNELFRDLHTINIPLVLAILVGGALTVAAVRRVVPRLVKRAPARLRHELLPLATVLRLTIYVAMTGLIVPLVTHPSRERFVALLGASALAIGFAVKDYASSVIAGMVALFERTYRLGDRVQIGDTYGEVRALNLRTVKIVTPDDTAVYVPHDKIWNTAIYNANDGARTMLCVAKFYLHPAHDGARVREKLIDTALTSPYANLDQKVAVIASEHPWGTEYKLKAYVLDGRDEFLFTTDMTLRAKAALQNLGVQFALVQVAATPGRV
ncbi:MAG: mechanosensitive ion channel [Deltaproteobacteria bacterium]|nr:mechanosensitive ion channel [Deltaproteobacteria bacterium]MBI3387644.1 mechanosensitive ion channel [Deltaproteobacteria bacterium]